MLVYQRVSAHQDLSASRHVSKLTLTENQLPRVTLVRDGIRSARGDNRVHLRVLCTSVDDLHLHVSLPKPVCITCLLLF